MTDRIEESQDARAIANYIVGEAPKYGITDLSVMKLMKLVFLAHGWSFYFRDIPLIQENQLPEAWPYGPVYPQVYREYSSRGAMPITKPIINPETGLPYCPSLTEGQKKAIDVILQRYGKFSAFRLSSITHLPGSPWSLTIEADNPTKTISAEKMKTYYQNMAKEMGLP